MTTIINNKSSLDSYINHLRGEFEKHKYLRMDMKTGKQRTNLQNASLNLYCRQCSDELNDRGITFSMFFKEGVEVPWTQDIFKDNVWRPVQRAICNEESTTKPHTTEYPKIYDFVSMKMSQQGIFLPWPSKENMYG